MFTQVKVLSIIFLFSCSQLASAAFQPLKDFGENPGELTASYIQSSKQTKSVVVLLHGCVQNAETLAVKSGFTALAKQYKFTLLLPQQSAKNNVKTCFNWFSEQDTSKDQGEVLSIKNMISTVKRQADAEYVFIAGLSAGGAMTSALLTHYPRLFSAGVVIAGLPYPCANDLAKAISCMRNGPSQTIEELTLLAKQGNSWVSQWPRLMVITGKQDKVVNPKNSLYLANQWAKLSKQELLKSDKLVSEYQETLWQYASNTVQVALIEVNEIGHGLPVDSSIKGRDDSGNYLFKSSLDSANYIIDFWGLK